MKKVSLVMIAKNEELNIKRCLDSVEKSVDEMIVVDTGSTDKTKEIAINCGAQVYEFAWSNDFAEARNFGLSRSTGDWILSLDADEYLTKNHRHTIQSFINKENRIGRIKVISDFDNNGQKMQSSAYISRIFPKGVQYTGRIHEQLNSDLERRILNIEVLHSGYYQTNKTERNISLLTLALNENPNDAYYMYQLGKEYRNLKDYLKACEILAKSHSLAKRHENYYYSMVIEYLSNLLRSEQLKEAIQIIHSEEPYFLNHPDFYFLKGNILMNYLSTTSNTTINDLAEIEKAFLTCLSIGETSPFDNMIGTGSFLPAYNLGIYYELLGQTKKAADYYQLSAKSGYPQAVQRLQSL
jgi:glycosyltransferase involved in cell wall biosynthesis